MSGTLRFGRKAAVLFIQLFIAMFALDRLFWDATSSIGQMVSVSALVALGVSATELAWRDNQ